MLLNRIFFIDDILWLPKLRIALNIIIFKNIQQRKKMPYKSLKQERFFNVNRKKLEKQGVDVDEWNKASKGKKLPLRVPKKKK